MPQNGPDFVLRSRWSPLIAFVAALFLAVFGTALLFAAWQGSRIDCQRVLPGQGQDCALVQEALGEALGWLFSGEFRLKGVRDVYWAAGRGRSSSLMAIGAGAVGFGLFVFWTALSSLLLPARIRVTPEGSALRIRTRPGQLLSTRVPLEGIRSVRVVSGTEAFQRVYPRLSRLFGSDLPAPGPTEHEQSALLITLEEGRELVIANWVPVDRLSQVASELREYLGLREAGPAAGATIEPAPVAGKGEAELNVFRTGHPRLHQAGQVLVAVTGFVLLVWVIAPMNPIRMIPGLGIGGVVFLLARELMCSQEITVDSPVIRVRRKAVRGHNTREERISSFSRIELTAREGEGARWFRAMLVHSKESRASVMFAQGNERAEIARQCERMAALTGLPFQGGSG